ncbi:MAG: Fic family protein [Xanthobacteraceae bacterium]
MAIRGTVIALSGAKGVYTGALGIVVAEILGWKRVRFSDFIRERAVSNGENADDTGVLQRIGQQLVQEQPESFVRSVLKMVGWTPAENLILDGLRHAEVFRELHRQIGPSADLRVVHINIGDRARRADRAKRAEGLTNDQFDLYDKDATEVEVEQTPAYANLTLDGTEPRGELAKAIISRFVPAFSAQAPADDRESPSKMEPLIVATSMSALVRDLMLEANAFAKEVPPGLVQPLAELVRAMNCYYSNRIEGHNAPLVDIELALNGDYQQDPNKRYLQAEARAHISVQRKIDGGGLSDQPATSAQSLMKIHDWFFSEFPEAQLVEDAALKRKAYVIPGHYRGHFTKVGLHEPPSPGSIPRFMARFESAYNSISSPEEAVLAVAAAHHRLLWIHPFGDGNGRVARLMSDAMLSKILDTHSIWSVSRGLALSDVRYKQLLAACDLGRRNDLDGRGNLSEETLAEFTSFFLNTCLEQVRFMRQRMRLEDLGTHIDRWVETSAAYDERGATEGKHHPRIHPTAGQILKAVLDEGGLGVSEARQVLGTDVDADAVLRQLIEAGVLRQRGQGLTFSLPAHLAERFLPGLFP